MTNHGSLGVLEVLPGGSGFIRRKDSSYTPGKDDIYVGARVIQKFDLRTGDELEGQVGSRPKNGKSPPLKHLSMVNGVVPEELPGVLFSRNWGLSTRMNPSSWSVGGPSAAARTPPIGSSTSSAPSEKARGP